MNQLLQVNQDYGTCHLEISRIPGWFSLAYMVETGNILATKTAFEILFKKIESFFFYLVHLILGLHIRFHFFQVSTQQKNKPVFSCHDQIGLGEVCKKENLGTKDCTHRKSIIVLCWSSCPNLGKLGAGYIISLKLRQKTPQLCFPRSNPLLK